MKMTHLLFQSLKAPTLLLLLLNTLATKAQMLTGNWHGKINGQKAEVKLIKSGDSITGTSYYYTSANNYRRYSIQGYFDEKANQVVWWDDQLITQKASGIFSQPGKVPQLARADFNCPGGANMYLDGNANEKKEDVNEGSVHLQKIYNEPVFSDEWNWVIDNFTAGTNDPYIIDSIASIALLPLPQQTVTYKNEIVIGRPATENNKTIQPVIEKPVTSTPPSIDQKFIVRKKKIFTTIPVTGDTISLTFYDNAIVDGDSISLFLDGKIIFTHIKLSSKAYTIKIATTQLQQESELVMVAENLGDIPPNTAYMVAVINNKQHTANLASTEESSAVIRLVKEK